MARKSLVVKQQKMDRKRTRIYKARTQAEEKGEDFTPPKDWQPTKYYNRCKITGKTRSYMRKFGVCREVFREYANKGEIMGIKKSSW